MAIPSFSGRAGGTPYAATLPAVGTDGPAGERTANDATSRLNAVAPTDPLEQWLLMLTGPQRLSLLLRERDRKSVADIAAVLGARTGEVREWLFQARERWRKAQDGVPVKDLISG